MKTQAELFKQSLTANAYALPIPSEEPVTTERRMERLKITNESLIKSPAVSILTTRGTVLHRTVQ